MNPFSIEGLTLLRKYPRLPSRAFELAADKISGKWKGSGDADVLSFYVLASAGAKDVIIDVLRKRIISELKNPYTVLSDLSTVLNVRKIDKELAEHADPKKHIAVSFRELLDVLDKIDITQLDLVNGWVLAEVGDNELMRTIVDIYLSKIEKEIDRAPKIDDPRIKKIAELLKKRSERRIRIKAGELKAEAFPPCVKIALSGVEAGYRNYAVTMLLTSFLSKARLGDKKKLTEEDVEILKREVLPIIYEAAEKCSPPLFEDQPHEKKNIHYHLGFGLSEEIKLEYFGKSRWYMVPNCEKIRREAPKLCSPDEICGKIRNPLSYYITAVRKQNRKPSQL